MPDSVPPDDAGRFAYEGLDRVLHEKARLGILTALITRPGGVVFGELKQLCALTDGNLNRHLEVLSEAGLVTIHKAFEGKRPQTTLRLTAEGRKRFRAYVEELEQVIEDAHAAEQAAKAHRRPGLAAD